VLSADRGKKAAREVGKLFFQMGGVVNFGVYYLPANYAERSLARSTALAKTHRQIN
jgi:hypothetical protein